MSIRRKYVDKRLTLIRTCQMCGKTFTTTADTPFMRQICNVDGKKQKTCYFCSEHCKAASYKHIGFYDGKAEQRRMQREANRDIKEKNRRYYLAHIEHERERSKARYWANIEESKATAKYNKKKQKLLSEEKRS